MDKAKAKVKKGFGKRAWGRGMTALLLGHCDPVAAILTYRNGEPKRCNGEPEWFMSSKARRGMDIGIRKAGLKPLDEEDTCQAASAVYSHRVSHFWYSCSPSF